MFIASDSTASNYPPNRYPQAGWGMMLKCGLAADISVLNRVNGCHSRRTSLSEGRWAALLKEARSGDVRPGITITNTIMGTPTGMVAPMIIAVKITTITTSTGTTTMFTRPA